MKDFRNLIERAWAAGYAAAIPAKGQNVTVTNGKQDWELDDFPCGFAWIEFKGNTEFGRWAKANGLASKHYPSGLAIWVSDFGQSMTKKLAFARAYAKVLTEAGIDCYANSRMD